MHIVRTVMTSALVTVMATPLAAQNNPPPAPVTVPMPTLTTPAPVITRLMSPSEVVATAPVEDWVAIEPADLLIMDLAPDARGRARRVVIQLMPAPFSQGWVGNIRTLASARWWDGLSINRVQDNYVVQWGDADGEDAARARALPTGLTDLSNVDYMLERDIDRVAAMDDNVLPPNTPTHYATFSGAFPVYGSRTASGPRSFPIHCYGSVGVGRNLAPDTGSGAELYTVIGHAPSHLNANIAVVGRVIEGIEHLSSLPRGTEALGFYATAEERVTIQAIRLGSALPSAEQPHFQYLNPRSGSFMRYADARANRRDPFFNIPAGGADVCNIPVPTRRAPAAR